MLVRDSVATNIAASDEQLYGIEVELENYRTPASGRVQQTWHITDDGSLRNNGVEFVTPGAWTFEQCIDGVRFLWRDIAEFRYQSSVRTGIHVHVNCLDYTNEQVGGILATYCLLEAILFRLCGPEREEGIYCVPWYRADNEVDLAATYVQDGDMNPLMRACKYSALYIGPLTRFGTIEFRHAPTFARESDMLLWLTAIDRLVAYGKTRTAEQVVAEYETTGADAWVAEVFDGLTATIRARCEDTFEALIDAVDCNAVAETLLPCNVPAMWSIPALYVQGEGTVGYHARAESRIGRRGLGEEPMYHIEEPDFDELYDEEDY